MSSLHKLKPARGSRPKKLIVGRGEGSTMGQTAGKGQKGQSSRAGDGVMTGFEGGQTPMVRRIPKRGFNHPSKIWYQPVNVGDLEQKFDAGTEINAQRLFEEGLIDSPTSAYKILGDGKLSKSFKIFAKRSSASAQASVKKAGGSIVSQ